MHRELSTVEAAAIRRDRRVWSLPPPARHHHIMDYMIERGVQPPINREQGFVLSNGEFVDRTEARLVAASAGQLLSTASKGSLLFSEDVW